MKPEITKDIFIEELVNHYHFSVKYLAEKGIKCIACGEPIWGTLEEAVYEKGLSENVLEEIVAGLKALALNQ